MFKKLIAIAGLLGGSVLFSGQVLAAADWGPCLPEGGTHSFSSVLDKTVTDTSKNVAGTGFRDFWSWGLGAGYYASCECPNDPESKEYYYYTATSTLPLGHVEGGREYYVLNNNIQFSADVWIGGTRKDYFTVPFENETNGASDHDACGVQTTFRTGSKGKLSLYISHPFVGMLDIPNIKILDIYGTRKKGVYGVLPLSAVFISGHITVPQGCELSSGSTLEIPFGEYKGSDFKDRKGQIPQGATRFTKELQFKCTNISDGVKIFLRIEGTPNANDSNAIDMGNPDIGAVIEGQNGSILVPNDTSSNQALDVSSLIDETHRVATTTITAYPVSTTGKVPEAGEYEGIATMRIDVE
ncbi:long polar fimbrial protein LpfD [Salmonella enterica]|nr:long polar fimbrial protein LpfD [Salmonella enterica]